MRQLIFLLTIIFISCNNLTKDQSFWEAHKNEFRYQDKTEFVSDSTLRADYKNLQKFYHPLFDRIFGNPAYLYSWQNRDKTKNEFTVIKDDGELGLKIVYFILDKKDSLLSWTQIGGRGGEGFYWFETRSKFISSDTLLNIGAITQDGEMYENNYKKMEKTKGDSTFSYLIIAGSGKVREEIFKEVKELNFEND